MLAASPTEGASPDAEGIFGRIMRDFSLLDQELRCRADALLLREAKAKARERSLEDRELGAPSRRSVDPPLASSSAFNRGGPGS